MGINQLSSLRFTVYGKEVTYDEEGNTQMDATDSRFDYLSSTHRPWRNELHGLLNPEIFRNLLLYEREILFVSYHIHTNTYQLYTNKNHKLRKK